VVVEYLLEEPSHRLGGVLPGWVLPKTELREVGMHWDRLQLMSVKDPIHRSQQSIPRYLCSSTTLLQGREIQASILYRDGCTLAFREGLIIQGHKMALQPQSQLTSMVACVLPVLD
jgi:hypothetical protein